jgi:hypothetical protein
MPSEARHTSGLCRDGGDVWAVDYRSNLLYLLDIEGSLAAGAVIVRASWRLPTDGSSACAVASGPAGPILLVSDFARTQETALYDLATIRGAPEGSVAAPVGQYRNCGLSQGLAAAGAFVFEACNRAGGDIIVAYDLASLFLAAGTAPHRAWVLRAPASAVEDLAVDGAVLYASDESTNHLYRADLPAQRTVANRPPRRVTP